MWNPRLLIPAFFAVFVLLLQYPFGAPDPSAPPTQHFAAPLAASESDIVLKLSQEHLIRSTRAFDLVLTLRGLHGRLAPGGYRLSERMNAWEVATAFANGPSEKWLVIPEGKRKEEIADVAAGALGWTAADTSQFVKAMPEGFYFPDTYLVPVQESGKALAARMLARFNEEFAPLAPKFLAANIRSDTALKIASLIERERGNESDSPIIAGIIWNRLTIGMKLDIDATLQYARGKVNGVWWAPISPRDKRKKSPYNTYLVRGLPPTPISNPGLGSIEAVLAPAKTKCLFYIHDADRHIHCAETYAEHQANIARYLK